MQHPATTRKLVYYIAVSIDHYIAHEDESIDGFLMEGQHVLDYVQSLRDYDAVLMGRRTYEWGYQFGLQPGQPVPTYGHMQQYVFSTTLDDADHEQLHIVRDNPADFVSTLKAGDGGSIYLCGGGTLAGCLLSAGLIDEVILKVNPVIFGAGIPLFSGVSTTIDLTLLNTKVYSNGALFAHYAINR